MKYNYIISIFLLIFVVIISQTIYIYSNKKMVEGLQKMNDIESQEYYRKTAEKSVADARVRYLAHLKTITINRPIPYVNLLGQAYNDNKNNDILKAFNEAKQVDELKNQTADCKNDSDIGKIITLTSNMLNSNAQNSTKVYFLSEIIIKAFGPFYSYDNKNNESQQNFLILNYPKTFKDDELVKNKYIKFISLMSLAQVSKSTTSSSLNPIGSYFITISSSIIEEAKKIINDINAIKYL